MCMYILVTVKKTLTNYRKTKSVSLIVVLIDVVRSFLTLITLNYLMCLFINVPIITPIPIQIHSLINSFFKIIKKQKTKLINLKPNSFEI